jgi:hypothetical protein
MILEQLGIPNITAHCMRSPAKRIRPMPGSAFKHGIDTNGRIPRSITPEDRATFMRTSKDVRLRNQRHAELLLRRRIEELDQRLAILNSERGRFEKALDGVCE